MMKKIVILILGLVIILAFSGCEIKTDKEKGERKIESGKGEVGLPSPQAEGRTLEKAILERRSKRDFKDQVLSLEQVGQILWAGQGVTDKERGFRSAPSAGALYPLELYFVVGEGRVEGLEAGVYWYKPREHAIEKRFSGEVRGDLAKACASQIWVGEAPVVIVVAADYERTTEKYGERGKRYVLIEVGHVGQNILLEAVSLGLGAVPVGAFDDQEVREILGLDEKLEPFYVIPVGHVKE